MAWDCTVQRINGLRPIEGADKIELAIIGNDWPVVVQKGKYAVNQLVSYLMADSIIPDTWLAQWGLTGKLSGAAKNRVKPVRLRGQLSIGLIAECPVGFSEGDSVASYYGIERYEEAIPVELRGQVVKSPRSFAKYDIDNIRANNWFVEGEEVVIHEKLHGCNGSFGCCDGKFFVNSRNYSLEEDENNTYWKAVNYHGVRQRLNHQQNIIIYCEILPTQDLKYGLNGPQIRVFDAKIDNNWLDYDELVKLCRYYDIPMVPELKRGPYSDTMVKECTDGMEQVSGKELHIREGCVIKPTINRYTYRGERVILKSVSADYLTRQGKTTELH